MRTVAEATISSAWVSALEGLVKSPKGKEVNLVVGFETIAEDPAIRVIVDEFLASVSKRKPKANVLPVETVASTLFPESWYVPERAADPRAHLYAMRERAARVHHRISGPREVETYFDRLAAYRGADGIVVNQLEVQVERLQRQLRSGGPMSSAYEIGVSDMGDLRIQSPGRDRLTMGFPCLSHISLSLHDGAIHLTALYRNQGFLRKAYGNYVGLARLARFFAREVGVDVGEICCIASHADAELSVSGKRALEEVIDACWTAAGSSGPPIEVDDAG